ncbi:hypothetical protein B0H11DRAFT_2225400 [Mycena galericulata]|nr:hypothetical protein B0H11DRAFT_2225400 [Mycena galericulata]
MSFYTPPPTPAQQKAIDELIKTVRAVDRILDIEDAAIAANRPAIYDNAFERSLARLVATNHPIKISSPKHAEMLAGLILGLRVVAFWKELWES